MDETTAKILLELIIGLGWPVLVVVLAVYGDDL